MRKNQFWLSDALTDAKGRLTCKMKSRTRRRRCASWSGLDFFVTEPNQAAAISASRWQSARALMCLSKGSPVGETYFFFFLPVFFFAFAFFAFLAMLPSVIPKDWFNASRASTCMNVRVHH